MFLSEVFSAATKVKAATAAPEEHCPSFWEQLSQGCSFMKQKTLQGYEAGPRICGLFVARRNYADAMY